MDIIFSACIQILEKLNHHHSYTTASIYILGFSCIITRISVRIKYLTLICFDCFLGLYFKMSHQISINTIDNSLITTYPGQTLYLMSHWENLEWVSKNGSIFPRRLCCWIKLQNALILIMDMLAHVPRKVK